MDQGGIAEQGSPEQIFVNSQNPQAQQFLLPVLEHGTLRSPYVNSLSVTGRGFSGCLTIRATLQIRGAGR